MKSKNIKFLFLLVIPALTMISGCATMYIPGQASIPLLTEKDEGEVSLGVSTNSIHATAAYAFTDRYALLGEVAVSMGHLVSAYDVADLMNSGNEDSYFNSGSFKHRKGELALGLFDSSARAWPFEIYTGIGYGSAATQYGRFKNSYGSLFLQANKGLKKKRYELGMALRITGSWFDYTYPDFSDVMMNEQFPVLTAQWNVKLQVGRKRVKFYISHGLNYSYAIIDKAADEMRFGYMEGRKYNVFNTFQNNFYTISHFAVGANISF